MITLLRLARSGAAAAFVLQCSALLLSGQTQPADAQSADAKWKELSSRNAPPKLVSPAPSESQSESSREQYRAEVVNHFLKIANEARDFRRDNPTYAKAGDAKLIEAENLLKAALGGDKTLKERIDPLVSSIVTDKSVPSSTRFRIVSMAEHLLVRELAGNPEKMQIAREDSARYLVKEFPEEVGAYTTLLSAVRVTNDAGKIKAATAEVIESKAPFAAKAQARILAGRYELIGKSLADVANTALGRDNFFEKYRGKKTILYTWSAEIPSSVAYAKALSAQLSSDTLLVGYNLDKNVTGAKAKARSEALPGDQYFSEGGAGGWLALLLKLDAPRIVYETDEAGIIRDVAARPTAKNSESK